MIEHDGKQVSAGSLASITAALKIGGSVTAFVAGSAASTVANEVLFSFKLLELFHIHIQMIIIFIIFDYIITFYI